MSNRTKRITTVAMLCAAAIALTFFFRIPMVLFLKYDPKDVIIAIGGFIYGPFVSFLVSVITAAVEMVTFSETGFIGLVMNILSSCSFACTAAFVYKKKHDLKGAVTGLLCGVVCMTAVMLIWNYIMTPIYMKTPREVVAKMLPTVFLPFNLIKGGLNGAITMLLYKSVVTALRKSGLIEKSARDEKQHINFGVMALAAAVVITCVLITLALNGVF